MDEFYGTLHFIADLCAPPPSRSAIENPAVDTVAEHLDVYHVLAPQLSPKQKLEHARRIVDAVLAMNGAKVIR